MRPSTRRPSALLAATALAAAALLATACTTSSAGDADGGGGGVTRIYTLRLSFPDGTERVDVREGETARLVREDAVYEFVPRLSHDRRGQLELTARRTRLNITQEGVLVRPMNDPTGIDFATTGIDISQELGGDWPSVGVKVVRVRPPVMPGSWMPSN
jgi:hypothetical protein